MHLKLSSEVQIETDFPLGAFPTMFTNIMIIRGEVMLGGPRVLREKKKSLSARVGAEAISVASTKQGTPSTAVKE